MVGLGDCAPCATFALHQRERILRHDVVHYLPLLGGRGFVSRNRHHNGPMHVAPVCVLLGRGAPLRRWAHLPFLSAEVLRAVSSRAGSPAAAEALARDQLRSNSSQPQLDSGDQIAHPAAGNPEIVNLLIGHPP